MNKLKRERGVNFDPEEKKVLLKISNKYKLIIENKKTNGLTWKAKEECWKRIEKEFNTQSVGPPRTSKQLKMKYESIKKEIKRKYMEHKASLEGASCDKSISFPIACTQEEKELTKIILASVDDGFKSLYDFDTAKNEDDPENCPLREENNLENQETSDWDHFAVSMFETPIQAVLQLEQEVNNTNANTESVNLIRENEKRNINIDTRSEVNQNEKGEPSWTSTQRPILIKKRSQNQFEDLVEKKIQLFDILMENAKEQNSMTINCAEELQQQLETEYSLRIDILKERKRQEEFRTKLLQYEIEMAKHKLERFVNKD